jgi:hypothetical protein
MLGISKIKGEPIMKYRARLSWVAGVVAVFGLESTFAAPHNEAATRQLAHDIFNRLLKKPALEA